MSTNYHAKYFAYDLTRAGGTGVDRLGRALFDASVDLNPHQIEAALFALRSPLSKGVLLADEVGLGKTIEAGLVLCQKWAENHRKILVICPASLRKQWALELEEKFNLPTCILDAKTYKELQKSGNPNPFDINKVIICSMHFVAGKNMDFRAVPWHLVVIDEAHKLRNAYRENNRIGRAVREATQDRKTILMTATPLQNSLLELYGLSTLIDENIFGDVSSFRAQYVNHGGDLSGLRERLQGFCLRTLRSQVTEYISYTERRLITRPFQPTEQEHKLYKAVSRYLMRDSTYGFPAQQRHLLILLIRKVLASSPAALAGTLEKIKKRLQELLESGIDAKNTTQVQKDSAGVDLYEDEGEEILTEILKETEESSAVAGTDTVSLNDKVLHDNLPATSGHAQKNAADENQKPVIIDIKKLSHEIEELEDYIHLAKSIGVDTKTKSLLTALDIGFQKMQEMGAARKAVIFTESRRTQNFLWRYLEDNGYAGKVVTFNGTNKDQATAQLYEQWKETNKDSGKVSGSRQIDMRAAILDHFKDEAHILIATEAGAEGLNMQFCSQLINFDLPWNPQRIEQRIGRCHRYGQKHDVVVINFLNEKNEADKRVYELLEHKFNLFTGVFGASDDVLGSIESGVDFEKRVTDIYQDCRTEKEISRAFSLLQQELETSIKSKMTDTRKMLLEHFDEDVHDRLKVNLAGTREKLDRIGRNFWTVTRQVLGNHAEFDDENFCFRLYKPFKTHNKNKIYQLVSKNREVKDGQHLYRLNHPLGESVIKEAQHRPCSPGEVCFDISGNPSKIAVVEKLKGKSGWLMLNRLKIDSFETEEYLLFSGIDEHGKNLNQETCEKLFNCMGSGHPMTSIPREIETRLTSDAQRHIQSVIAKNIEANNKHLSEACIQLDKWAEDMEKAAAKDMADTKRKIADIRRKVRLAENMQQQAEHQSELKKLEKLRRRQQQKIFDVEDEIADKRDALVDQLTRKMEQKTQSTILFSIKWRVI